MSFYNPGTLFAVFEYDLSQVALLSVTRADGTRCLIEMANTEHYEMAESGRVEATNEDEDFEI